MAENEKNEKAGMGLKAKKYLTSKVAKSTLGQNAIKHFLGPNGTSMLDALKHAAAKDKGEAEGKELITHILVLACKAKILHDAKKITPEDRKNFTSPVNTLALQVYQELQESKQKTVDVAGLSLRFAWMEEMVCILLAKHIKQKNVDKAHAVFQYFGSKHFLNLLFNDKDYTEYKSSFNKQLTLIMTERLREEDLLPPPRICKEVDCPEEAAMEDGKFKGSVCCPKHHEEQYKALLKKPSVKHFLFEAGAADEAMRAMLDKSFPAQVRPFLIGLNNYSKAKPNISRVFAEGLYEKYIHPTKATHKVEGLSDGVTAALHAAYEKDTASRFAGGLEGLWDDASKELAVLTESKFDDTSQEYKDYLIAAKMP